MCAAAGPTYPACRRAIQRASATGATSLLNVILSSSLASSTERQADRELARIFLAMFKVHFVLPLSQFAIPLSVDRWSKIS